MLIVMTSFGADSFTAPALRATFLDVGDSDSCLIEFPGGETMLIDTGFSTPYLDCGERLIAPYLWKKGIRAIDTLVLTHSDADHTGGAPFLLKNFSVGRLLLADISNAAGFSHILEVARQNGCPVRKASAGDVLTGFTETRIEVLNPPPGHPGVHLADNDTSLVLRITYGKTSLLLTGDAERSALRFISHSGKEFRGQVLKAPHHGLRSGFNRQFVSLAQPELIVISGRVHRTNQQMEERSKRYSPFCKTVLSTSKSGAIIVETDGEAISTQTTRRAREVLF
jgi:competence protein ComEC